MMDNKETVQVYLLIKMLLESLMNIPLKTNQYYAMGNEGI